MFIFLDESGNFTKYNHEEYFVIGSFTVGDQRRTSKAIRAWFHERFPRKMRAQAEVKWSQSGIEDALRLKTIKHIARLDVRVRLGYLLRKNIPDTYRQKNKIKSGVLYTNIICEILQSYFPTDDKEVYIFCDKRSLKGMTKSEFESTVRSSLLPLCSAGTRIEVTMIDSAMNPNMQIVDWICGAYIHALEGRPFARAYRKALNNTILSEQEFFTSSV